MNICSLTEYHENNEMHVNTSKLDVKKQIRVADLKGIYRPICSNLKKLHEKITLISIVMPDPPPPPTRYHHLHEPETDKS